jgi:hypothetical protein
VVRPFASFESTSEWLPLLVIAREARCLLKKRWSAQSVAGQRFDGIVTVAAGPSFGELGENR